LMRKDFGDIVDMYSGFILGIPTIATRALQHAKRLAGKVAYVNVGLEGPRAGQRHDDLTFTGYNLG